MLTRLIKKIKKSNDGEDSEFIVCDNRYLPFSDKAFDAVVSVAGYAHRKEIKRVLREEGTEILIGAELI
jgi:ubiquinone/menaquinone biosynthesis C-methylase UbiE